jgi:hypothetical protein
LDESSKVQSKISNVKEGFSISAGALIVKPLTSESFLPGKISNYEPGFQVSADYQAHENWDYALKFKHFDFNGDFNRALSGGTSSLLNSFFGVNSKYATNYNMLDLEIGKLFTLSDNISLRVSGGIRSTIMNENSSYVPAIDANPFSITNNGTGNLKNNFWGLGPRVTASPMWKPFGNNFQVFGNVGAGFVMGENNFTFNRSYCSGWSMGGCIASTSYSASDRRQNFVTTIEAGSGIGYTIKANLVDIDLKAGYQFERWITSSQPYNLMFTGYHGAYGTIGIKF